MTTDWTGQRITPEVVSKVTEGLRRRRHRYDLLRAAAREAAAEGPEGVDALYMADLVHTDHDVLIVADACRSAAQTLRTAAAQFEWAGDDEDYTAFRDWLNARADRIDPDIQRSAQ